MWQVDENLNKSMKISEVLPILVLLFLQDFVDSTSSRPDNSNFRRISSTQIQNEKNIQSSTSTENTIKPVSVKKWQVGRVSRKQYEIVNMLWRKTKIFLDTETTSAKQVRRKQQTIISNNRATPNMFSLTRPYLLSTPSFIEFYYLEDTDESVSRKYANKLKTYSNEKRAITNNNNMNIKSSASRYPILSFNANNPAHKSQTRLVSPDHLNNVEKALLRSVPYLRKKSALYDFLSNKLQNLAPKVKPKPISQVTRNDPPTRVSHYDYETCPSTIEDPEKTINMTLQTITLETDLNQTKQNVVTTVTTEPAPSPTTTAYDRIKFFEMYDQYTPSSKMRENIIFQNDIEIKLKENYSDGNHKIILEDIDKSSGHHDGIGAKNVKKHISERSKDEDVIDNRIEQRKPIRKFKSVTFHVNNTYINSSSKNNFKYTSILKNLTKSITVKEVTKVSQRALWTDFPFAAVYVYEPSQIHCDAAALSSHWLVAAGSCLSRFHRKDPMAGGRSAFIAYCGERWWDPERVTYVKYSLVHPKYHPKDKIRSILYNIGLIQVAGAMSSSCVGWAPISLMSHHFAAEPQGSLATAVGWGLDRFDIRYTSSNLPKIPLSVYEQLVYTHTCPGRNNYSEMLMLREEDVSKSIYCLSLPPYLEEEKDPVHGSMLLVGGKLIALYLQEERRLWGAQSAQYTSIWKLVPWVHEVAREPDEFDTLEL